MSMSSEEKRDKTARLIALMGLEGYEKAYTVLNA